MNHKTFTMTVILTTFAAAMWFGYLFVSDHISGGGFFLYMAATIPALLLFRILYSLILRNRRPCFLPTLSTTCWQKPTL